MKTIIVSGKELESLDKNLKNALLLIIEKRETTISELKDRIKKLSYQLVSYRDDIDKITRKEECDFLTFRIWRKTQGEQWGNNCGNEYVLKFGNKYIRFERSFWNSERNLDYDNGPMYVSLQKCDELVSLIEQAQNSGNEVDEEALLQSVCVRISSICNPYQ